MAASLLRTVLLYLYGRLYNQLFDKMIPVNTPLPAGRQVFADVPYAE